MKPVLVIGSTCVDIIINIDHLPKTEENLRPSSQSMSLGGCAYNVANILKLSNTPFTFISPVGGGTYGSFVETELKKQNYPILISVPEQENGCCYCLVEASGERTFMSYHGAEYTFKKEWMKPYPAHEYSMVYVCGLEVEEPTGENLVEYLEEHPGPQIFFAPGPRVLKISNRKMERLMRLSPVLHINEQESYAMSGCGNVEDAARALHHITGSAVIITLGAHGVYCLEPDKAPYHVPSQPAEVVDTIGAGDAHIGAILSCLHKGMELRQAVAVANRISGAVVGVKGASLTQAALTQAFGQECK